MRNIIKAVAAVAVTLSASSAFATLPDPCCHVLDKHNKLASQSTSNSFAYDVTSNNVVDFTVSANIGELVQFRNGLGINDGYFDDNEIEQDNGTRRTEIITVTFPETVKFKGFYAGGYNYTTGIFGDHGTIEFTGFDAAGNAITSASLTQSDSTFDGYDRFNFDVELTSFSLYTTRDTDFSLAAICYDDVADVPVPAAAWLFGSALLGLAGARRKK